MKRKDKINVIIIEPQPSGKVNKIYTCVGQLITLEGIPYLQVKLKDRTKFNITSPTQEFYTKSPPSIMLVDLGNGNYKPILPNSLRKVEIPNGDKIPISELRGINQMVKAWGVDNYESAIRRFTFQSLFDKWKRVMLLMFFIGVLFVMMYISWNGMDQMIEPLAEINKELLRYVPKGIGE